MTAGWIVGGCLFGAGVLALLIYGIATHSRRNDELEEGLLGDLVPPKNWPPLTLVVDQELVELEDVIMVAVKEAAKWWHEQTGVKYFYALPELPDGGHMVPVQKAMTPVAADHDHAFAFVLPMVRKDTNELVSMSVNMMPGWESATYENLIEAMKHELGHCLCLAHDGYTESIMHKTVDARRGHVSDHDKKLLRETYDYA